MTTTIHKPVPIDSAGVRSPVPPRVRVSEPSDPMEREADRVADRVMRMTSGQVMRSCACDGADVARSATKAGRPAPAPSSPLGRGLGGGVPLASTERQFFDSRFGANFDNVRIHTGDSADRSARSIQADAYTQRGHIVFRRGQYAPHSLAGRRLLAHELTHVVQHGGPQTSVMRQATAPLIMLQSHDGAIARTPCVVGPGPFPGDGMMPPGDCSWATYVPLRASVESAKVVTNMLGGCGGADSCTMNALRIAAMTAEVAARVALDASCFRGGNRGHRIQVCDKVNAMMRCHRFFTGAGCSPELIAAMEVVVAAVRVTVVAATVALAIAAVVLLIAAIIALAKLIAAALAAIAAGAATFELGTAAVAAIVALLTLLQETIAPDAAA